MADPSWDAYYTAVLELLPEHQPRVEVELARRLEPARIGLINQVCPGPTFAVITACNPGGAGYSDQENEERALDLEARLSAASITHIRADGCSVDRQHRERGVAARLDRYQARDLAAELGQSAIYWWDGCRFWLVPVLELGREPEALPVGDEAEPSIPEEHTLRMTDFLRDSDFSAR